MRKILVLVLAFFLLTGCVSPSQPFHEYLDELMKNVIDEKDIGINLSFIDPQAFGIEPGLYELGFNTEEDYEDMKNYYEEAIKTLKSYKNLNKQEQLDRDVLIAYFESYLDDAQYYEFIEGSVLNYSRSFMLNLPAFLEVYQFREKEDIERYFHFIETLPKFFQKYLDFELSRQEKGLGYGQEIIDQIISVLDETIQRSQTHEYFLIENFNNKLKNLNFKVDAETLSTKHENLLKNEFTDAHKLLRDGLNSIEADFTKGLAHYKGGRQFYEHQLQKNTGLDMGVDEIQKMLRKAFQKNMRKLSKFTQDDFAILTENDFYPKYENGRELLDFLSDAILEDFPEAGQINYDIVQVDQSMAEASSPAYYFTPHIDYDLSEKQYIFINGDHNAQLYTTYAHEGFPGHMYQFNYFLNLDMHPIRHLLTVGANAEGWANYAENYALKYIVEESVADKYLVLQQLNTIVTSLIDIGIHYEGWLLPDMLDYLVELGWVEQDARLEDFEDIYVYIAANPAVYPMYYVSSLKIIQLKESFKGSDLEFHKAFLDVGPARFSVIEKYIKK